MLSANQITTEINVGHLVAVVSEVTGVPSNQITSRCKLHEACTARNIAWKILYEGKQPAQKIGLSFDRTHGAVLSGIRRINLDMKQDFRVFEKVIEVQKRIQTPEESKPLMLIAERFTAELADFQSQIMQAKRELFTLQQDNLSLTQEKQRLGQDVDLLTAEIETLNAKRVK